MRRARAIAVALACVAALATEPAALAAEAVARSPTAPAHHAREFDAAGVPVLDEAARALAEVSNSPVRGYSTRDFGRERYDGARSALVPEADAARLLAALRPRLPPGTIAFVGNTHSLADPPAQGVELVVAPGADQFDILRVAASDAVNYGKLTDDLIRELQAWDREFGIDIWQAETDTIQLRLRTLPKDLPKFARRVYAFCPDIVDQGVGDVAALAKSIASEKSVFLWWD